MSEILYVRHGRLHYFVRETLKRLRMPAMHASKVGDVLVAANLAGIEGEGVSRLPYFASKISSGLINSNANIRLTHQEDATACLDGDNGMGHLVASRSMEIAIALAKQHGVSAVSSRNSNDFGMAGYYARLALEDQMLGLVASNATPTMVPTYGKDPLLGENPLAIAIPTTEDLAPFVLDIAMTATSRHQLEDAIRHDDRIEKGLALNANGFSTDDPKVALENLRLLPLGSHPKTGSHKGYGLALAIQILCDVVASGATTQGAQRDVAGVGHFFIAIRLRAFGPWIKFRNKIKELIDHLKTSPSTGAPQIYYPGEAEFDIEQERRATGIPLDFKTQSELSGLAKQLDIKDSWEHLIEGRK